MPSVNIYSLDPLGVEITSRWSVFYRLQLAAHTEMRQYNYSSVPKVVKYGLAGILSHTICTVYSMCVVIEGIQPILKNVVRMYIVALI